MKDVIKPLKPGLEFLELNYSKLNWNLEVDQLTKICMSNTQGSLTNKNVLSIKTGEFTGRSPKDRYIVKDKTTSDSIYWGDINIPIDTKYFDDIYTRMKKYISNKELFLRNVYACSSKIHKVSITVINEYSWSDIFSHNMFIKPNKNEIYNFKSDWQIINIPSFKSIPEVNKTRSKNFVIINFSKKIILIGGTGYTGEIKKSFFTVLNLILPIKNDVLSMHCSANIGKKNDSALFFGLSGTGKTTLSSDPERFLIGDDEHGWDKNEIFNFEGGCYAKCINLSKKSEPGIYDSIKKGALLENIPFIKNTNIPDFKSKLITENTRVSYPIKFSKKIKYPSIGPEPKNIFFLTCDAFGILPPISKLSINQTMYHFISGYTAKVAGTETNILEPVATFSACFGEPFLPLHPIKYAIMLGKRLKNKKINVWLINTGWSGGPYGIGKRINLEYTRKLINTALNDGFNNIEFETTKIFNLLIPKKCPGIPNNILNPRNCWTNKDKYDSELNNLSKSFNNNFKKYEKYANEDIISASPKLY